MLGRCRWLPKFGVVLTIVARRQRGCCSSAGAGVIPLKVRDVWNLEGSDNKSELVELGSSGDIFFVLFGWFSFSNGDFDISGAFSWMRSNGHEGTIWDSYPV